MAGEGACDGEAFFMHWIPLGLGGLGAGLLAGILGIGGGTVLVPVLVALGVSPIQAIATSSWAIVITSLSGTVQNWRMGLLRGEEVVYIGLPALVATQLGVVLATILPSQVLLIAFGLLMLLNIYLMSLRQELQAGEPQPTSARTVRVQRLVQGGTGMIAGAIAGLLGVGGGAIMVPLQMLLLGVPIKRAIQTSLGVVVLTAIASTVGHGVQGNVLWGPGLVLGLGGLLGAQLSTRLLPKLPSGGVSLLFRLFLLLSAAYSFWQAAGG